MADLGELCRAALSASDEGEAVEAYAAESRRTQVRARGGEVESLSFAETRGVGVRVIAEGRLGYAYAADPSPEEVGEAVARARENARLATPDEANGLPGGRAPEPLPGIFRASQLEVPTERKVALALDLERTAVRSHPAVRKVEQASYDQGHQPEPDD